MLIDTLRFGSVHVDDDNLLNFPGGLPGLEDFSRFAILRFDDSYPIIWLQSLRDSKIALPVIDTFSIIPDYSFVIPDEEIALLSLNSSGDLLTLSVLVIPDNIEAMTANLAAPILINTKNGVAHQMIINSGEYSVRYPVFNDILTRLKEDESSAGSVTQN